MKCMYLTHTNVSQYITSSLYSWLSMTPPVDGFNLCQIQASPRFDLDCCCNLEIRASFLCLICQTLSIQRWEHCQTALNHDWVFWNYLPSIKIWVCLEHHSWKCIKLGLFANCHQRFGLRRRTRSVIDLVKLGLC